MSKRMTKDEMIRQLENDFRQYIDSQVHKTYGVYACNLCKHGTEYAGGAGCDKSDCDGVLHWEWRGPVKERSD